MSEDSTTTAFHPIRDRLRQRLIDAVVEKGAPVDKATEAADTVIKFAANSDRPFLDWLLNGGFEKLLTMVLELLSVFLAPKPKEQP